jgi:hypothetical protein
MVLMVWSIDSCLQVYGTCLTDDTSVILSEEAELELTNRTISSMPMNLRYTNRPLSVAWFNVPSSVRSFMVVVHPTALQLSSPVWMLINISPNISGMIFFTVSVFHTLLPHGMPCLLIALPSMADTDVTRPNEGDVLVSWKLSGCALQSLRTQYTLRVLALNVDSVCIGASTCQLQSIHVCVFLDASCCILPFIFVLCL